MLAGSVAAAVLVGLAPSALAGRGPQASAAGWQTQSPPAPPGSIVSELTGISCSAASSCLAVGNEETNTSLNTAFAEGWTGSTWRIRATPEPSGATKARFNGVSCATGTSCVAVGAVTVPTSGMLAEGWNGTRWTLQSTPSPSGGSQASLHGVSCPATTTCTATGSYYVGGTALSLAERWDGTSWTQQSTPNPPKAVSTGFDEVSCPSVSLCIAVGGGTTQRTTRSLAEIWHGSAWTLSTPGQPAGAALSVLSGVSCPSTADCTAVGGWAATTAGSLVPLAAQYS